MSQSVVPSPVELFKRATAHAADVMSQVQPEQLAAATPCSDWTVQDLIDHMVGGTTYLQSALAGEAMTPVAIGTVEAYRSGVQRVLEGLSEPGALERTCQSPLQFEWTLGQAVAGTFMDQLIHTWDLASATGQDPTLDPELVQACTDMFLPEMPELGRTAGIIGPAVAVPSDASPQALLIAAMGRQP